MRFNRRTARVRDDSHGWSGLSGYRPESCDLAGVRINRCGGFRNALLEEQFPCEQYRASLKTPLHRLVDEQVG